MDRSEVPNPRDTEVGCEALDLSAASFERALEAVGRRLGAFLESLPRQPAAVLGEPPPELLSSLQEPLPEKGLPLDRLLDDLFGRVVPQSLNTAGPGYLAYIPGGGLLAVAIAELIADAVNRYSGVWVAAPAAAEIETQSLRWFAELMGFPPGSLGVLTSGGSMSNLLAFVAAREKLLGPKGRLGVVYVSSEVHHSITKAARIAGIPPENVRAIEVDAQFRMRLDCLCHQITEDRGQGLIPFFVCGTAGTINTGAVDPLAEIAEVARREELWFHVDGAYGAAFRIVPALEGVFRGLERADSLAVDPHKGFFFPYGTGVLVVRNVRDLHRAFHGSAPYLPAFRDGREQIDFCELTPELSREWRGLRLWLPFKWHGVDAFRRALAEKRELALQFYDELAREPDVEIPAPPELSLFAFRQRFRGCTAAEEDQRNRQLLERINQHGPIFMTGTQVNAAYYLRVVVLHLRTRADRIAEAMRIIRAELVRGREETNH